MFVARLTHTSQDFLDENDEILRAQDRRQRDRIFQAIHNGKSEVDIDFAGGPASTSLNMSWRFVLLHVRRPQKR